MYVGQMEGSLLGGKGGSRCFAGALMTAWNILVFGACHVDQLGADRQKATLPLFDSLIAVFSLFSTNAVFKYQQRSESERKWVLNPKNKS